MSSPFATADWIVMAGYVALLFFGGWWFTPRASKDVRDYFLADGQIPVWLAAASVLSATQSAATFLGAPDYGYRGDFTYVGVSISALIAAFIVSRLLIPRFYAAGVTTVTRPRRRPGCFSSSGACWPAARGSIWRRSPYRW